MLDQRLQDATPSQRHQERQSSSLRSTTDQAPEFPVHLTSMESSRSENAPSENMARPEFTSSDSTIKIPDPFLDRGFCEVGPWAQEAETSSSADQKTSNLSWRNRKDPEISGEQLPRSTVSEQSIKAQICNGSDDHGKLHDTMNGPNDGHQIESTLLFNHFQLDATQSNGSLTSLDQPGNPFKDSRPMASSPDAEIGGGIGMLLLANSLAQHGTRTMPSLEAVTPSASHDPATKLQNEMVTSQSPDLDRTTASAPASGSHGSTYMRTIIPTSPFCSISPFHPMG